MIESFYTTIVMMAPAAYGDFTPKTPDGQLFTVVLIILGVGTMLYTVGMLAETMVEGRLRALVGKGKQGKMIEKLKSRPAGRPWRSRRSAITAGLSSWPSKMSPER